MSNDPKGFELVNPMEDLGKPRSNFSIMEANNWYVYCSNNPVRFIDPNGLDDGTPELAKRYNNPYKSGQEYVGDNIPEAALPYIDPNRPQPDGYNVYATTDGVYKGAKWNAPRSDPNNKKFGSGYYASIKGDDGGWYNYGHMDPSIKPNLKPGDKVKAGQYIGRLANPSNGNTTGPHSHIEKWVKNSRGKWINKDPGHHDSLGGAGRPTAGYPNYSNGTYHGGRDYAPKIKFRINIPSN